MQAFLSSIIPQTFAATEAYQVLKTVYGEGKINKPTNLTFPYLLNRFFKSVALVVEASPLTQKFLPELLEVRPNKENKHTYTPQILIISDFKRNSSTNLIKS